MKSTKNKIPESGWFCAAALIMTLAAGVFRIRFGWDWDQSYMLLLAERIAHGKVLFRDLWDLHQTSAILSALAYALYTGVTGGTEGVAVFLRICSLLVQYGISIWSYFVLKRHYDRRNAFLTSIVIASFLPRAVQLLEYSTMGVWGALICSLLLLDLWKRPDHPHPYLTFFAAGFFYSVSVFSFPTMILSLPYMAVLLTVLMPRNDRGNLTYALLFFGACAFSVILFVGYLSMYIPVSEIPGYISAILESGDHPGFFLFLTKPSVILKSAVRTAALFAVSLLVSFVMRKRVNVRDSLFYVYAVVTTAVILILNLTGLRRSGPFGLLERYLGLVILGSMLGMRKTDRGLYCTVFLPGILIYAGSLAGSNLGLNENAMYLELSILAVILHAMNIISKKQTIKSRYEFASVAVLCFGIVFSSAYFVRIDGTKPANIMDCTAEMASGPLKDIRMIPEKEANVTKKGKAVAMLTDDDTRYLIITKEPISYFYGGHEYDAPSYITTARFDGQWVNYYFGFGRPLPDRILIDRDLFERVSEFKETLFGKAILPYYAEQDIDADSPFLELDKR